MDDLGASNRGGKLGQVVFPLQWELIELVGKSCEILVCVRTPSVGAWSFAWVCGFGLCLLMNEEDGFAGEGEARRESPLDVNHGWAGAGRR